MTSICVKTGEDSYSFEIKRFNAEIISFEMKLLFDLKFQLNFFGTGVLYLIQINHQPDATIF